MIGLDGVAALVVTVPFLLGASSAPGGGERVAFDFADREINESSGLAVVDGLFVTVNDSGDSGRVFVVDPATGQTVGSTRWGDEPIDDEALAPGPDGTVWVGDIGDNRAMREDIVVRQVPVGRGERSADPPTYRLAYPDGPHDAETLLADPTDGRLYVATKGVFGGTLYAAPVELRDDAENQLTPVGDVLALATDGAFAPDGRHVVIRGYTSAVVYTMPELAAVGSVDLPAQPQGESIALDADARLFIGSEGVGSSVLRLRLPAELRRAVAGTAPSPSASPSTPAASESPGQRTRSREDTELPDVTSSQRSGWPWFLGGLLALAAMVILVRSLRTR